MKFFVYVSGEGYSRVFASREKLKALGFKFDATRKIWTVDLTVGEFDPMLKKLKEIDRYFMLAKVFRDRREA